MNIVASEEEIRELQKYTDVIVIRTNFETLRDINMRMFKPWKGDECQYHQK